MNVRNIWAGLNVYIAKLNTVLWQAAVLILPTMARVRRDDWELECHGKGQQREKQDRTVHCRTRLEGVLRTQNGNSGCRVRKVGEPSFKVNTGRPLILYGTISTIRYPKERNRDVNHLIDVSVYYLFAECCVTLCGLTPKCSLVQYPQPATIMNT